MIGALAGAVLVLVVRHLLGGTAIDLGPRVMFFAPGVLALGIGWGLLSRTRWPYLADTLGVALLVPARGLICDVGLGVAPVDWSGAPFVAAVLSLGPVGFVLGRQLSSLAQGGLVSLAAGWGLGELGVLAGLVGWLPGAFTGFVVAGLLAALVEMGRHRRSHRDGAAEERAGWLALPVGLALSLVAASLSRLVPAYVAPPVGAGSEVLCALLIPALLVAWPTRILAGPEVLRRVLACAGCLALGWALWKTRDNLTLYQFNPEQVQLTIQLNQRVDRGVELGLPATPWRVWLVVFAGWPAAALGLALGALGRQAGGPLACGLGLGLLAQSFVGWEPARAPEALMLAGSGVLAVACLGALHRRALVLAPLGLAVLAVDQDTDPPVYDEVRRVGETVVEAFDRTLLADLRVYRALGPGTNHPEARRAYERSFSRRVPFLVLGEEGAEEPSTGEPDAHAGHDHGHHDDPDQVPTDPGHLGLRLAGVDAHAGHDPMGPEGSLGRLHRLLVVPGRLVVTGLGSELAAADLRDSGLADQLRVSSAMPFSNRTALVIFEHLGSSGFVGGVDADPVGASRRLAPGSADTVVVAPERVEWPGAGTLLSAESFERLAAALAPGGRCLAWIDTTALGARALRARVAAFASVFGERSAAWVEMRELSPPFVLLMGWVDESGRPTADDLVARLPSPASTGRRTRLADLDDLAAHLLLDGSGMARLAASGPVHRRLQPVPAATGVDGGWDAVATLVDATPSLGAVVAGAAVPARPARALFDGLATHARYSYHVVELGGSMVTRIVQDVDWSAFDDEVRHYAEAAAADRDHPLLHLALAALLEPLARAGDYGRFYDVFTATGAEDIPSWRLALLQAYVLDSLVEEEAARRALDRARRWQAPVGGG